MLLAERVSRNNYSWLPPARGYLAYGLCLPGLNSRELGRLVIALDTSGSIDALTLAHFAVEVSSILEEYDTEVDKGITWARCFLSLFWGRFGITNARSVPNFFANALPSAWPR